MGEPALERLIACASWTSPRFVFGFALGEEAPAALAPEVGALAPEVGAALREVGELLLEVGAPLRDFGGLVPGVGARLPGVPELVPEVGALFPEVGGLVPNVAAPPAPEVGELAAVGARVEAAEGTFAAAGFFFTEVVSLHFFFL